jgi:hypothetical protein
MPRNLRLRVAVPGENRMGLPVSYRKCAMRGGVRGTGDNATVVSRASTKGGPRDRGAATWERLRPSTTFAEVCVDGVWEALGGSLVVVVVEAA